VGELPEEDNGEEDEGFEVEAASGGGPAEDSGMAPGKAPIVVQTGEICLSGV